MSASLDVKPFIEGVGNEVLWGLAALLGLVFSMALFSLNRLRRLQNPVIHPDSTANVESTRMVLRAHASTTSNISNISNISNTSHDSFSQGTHVSHVSQGSNISQVSNSFSPVEAAPQPPEAEEQSAAPQRVLLLPNNGQVVCPICLSNALFAVVTNCGHVYCGNCIITYWHHQNWLGAVPCPSCRTPVSLLLANFTTEELTDVSEDANYVRSEISGYNRRFSGEPRSIMDYIRDAPTLLQHAFREFFSLTGLIFMFRVRVVTCIIAAVVYFVSPLDIIPESVFGILGFMDDIFILLLLAIYISIIYRQVIEARAERGNIARPGT